MRLYDRPSSCARSPHFTFQGCPVFFSPVFEFFQKKGKLENRMNAGLPWVQFSICECEFLKFTSARTYFSLWHSCFLQISALPDRKSMKGSQKNWLKNPWSCTRIDFLSSILSESTLFFFLLFQLLHVLHLSLMSKFFICTLLGHEKIQKQWKALRKWNYLHIYWFWVQFSIIRLADWRIRLSSFFTKWYSWEIFDFTSSIFISGCDLNYYETFLNIFFK